jgi:hypothetical protein
MPEQLHMKDLGLKSFVMLSCTHVPYFGPFQHVCEPGASNKLQFIENELHLP